MGDRKLPKLRVGDLQFNYGTVLIATLNGRAVPHTFAVVGEEGDQLVQLVDEEQELRGYRKRSMRVPISNVPLAVRI